MRTTAPSVVVLAGVASASWVLLIAMGDEMPMGAGLWLGAWTVMMAAMVVTVAMPAITRGQRLVGRAQIIELIDSATNANTNNQQRHHY